MPDPADLAQAVVDQFQAQSLDNARQQNAGQRLTPRGRCHFCEDPLDNDQQLFCIDGCQEDYEYVRQRKQANGR